MRDGVSEAWAKGARTSTSTIHHHVADGTTTLESGRARPGSVRPLTAPRRRFIAAADAGASAAFERERHVRPPRSRRRTAREVREEERA